MGAVFIITNWFFCFLALFVTLKGSGNGTGCLTKHRKGIAAFAYIAASWGSIPGVLYVKYYVATCHTFSSWPLFWGGLCFTITAIIYALKFPERYFPGTFDIFGNSHQIFHFGVLAGSLFHIYSSWKMFHERQMFPCPESGHFE